MYVYIQYRKLEAVETCKLAGQCHGLDVISPSFGFMLLFDCGGKRRERGREKRGREREKEAGRERERKRQGEREGGRERE